MADSWGKQITDRIGDEIAELRGKRTIQWLEDRTDELGHKVSRSTINELENKKRKSVTVTDVLVLAAALEVPVARLIYGEDLVVEMLPGKGVPRPDALEALAGTAAEAEAAWAQIERNYAVMETALETVRKVMARAGISATPAIHVIDESHDGG